METTTPTNSPLPWRIEPSTIRGVLNIRDAGNNVPCVARVQSNLDANAAYIVKACNAFPALVQSLKIARQYVNFRRDSIPPEQADRDLEAIAAALREAGAE